MLERPHLATPMTPNGRSRSESEGLLGWLSPKDYLASSAAKLDRATSTAVDVSLFCRQNLVFSTPYVMASGVWYLERHNEPLALRLSSRRERNHNGREGDTSSSTRVCDFGTALTTSNCGWWFDCIVSAEVQRKGLWR